MKASKFSDAQIAFVLKQAEDGTSIGEVCRKAGIAESTFYGWRILRSSGVEHCPEDYWDSVMDVNAKGTFLVVQALLPIMKAQGYGRICNISSIGGKHGAPEQAHYSASKAAVMGFTRVLAQEVGPLGITANCICPGIFLTDMGRVNLDDPAISGAWKAKTAMARIGTPEDIAGPVAFFCSDDSAFVTGQTLNVDGGIVLS